jgi:ADP-L-glycero-D-manno-heptose 6-epimerase
LWRLNKEGITDIIVVDHLDSSEKWKNLAGKRFSDYIQKDDFYALVTGGKLQKPDCVVHLGACSSTTETNADYFIRNNFEYSKALAGWAIGSGVPFLYASSAATYGDGSRGFDDSDGATASLRPLNMYGYSKQLFDLWLLSRGYERRVSGFKYFNVFGPNEYHKASMMSVVCRKFPGLRDEGKIQLYRSYRRDYPDGGQKRDFIYVKDAVEVMMYFMKNPSKTGIFNLGTGAAHTWNDLAHAMFKAAGKKPVIEYIDMPETLRPKYQYFTEAKMDKLRAAGCAHRFTPLEDAVKDYITNYLMKDEYL